jgi:putative ABC transport system permease protein
MTALRKLVVSNLVAHRMRTLLTGAAIALSVSLVVAVTGGYASLEGAAYQMFSKFLGTTDVAISPSNMGVLIPETLVEQIRADKRVRSAIGRFETENAMPGEHTRSIEAIGIKLPDDTQIDQLTLEKGRWFTSSDGNDVVIDQAMVKQLKLKVGDELVLPGLKDDGLSLRIVGIVHKPDVMAQFRSTAYIPLHTLQNFKNYGHNITRIRVELYKSSEAKQFADDWTQKMATLAPGVRVRSAGEIRQMIGNNLEILHMASYMGGLVSMVAAMFIVFSALSMGVTERQRELAMLRAIGAFRSQIGWMVVIEGVIIAIVGSVAGVILGWLWIQILAWKFDFLFSAGGILSWGGVAFGIGGSVFSALAASLFPAFQAARVTPLEAMTPFAHGITNRMPWGCIVAGLLLIAIDPIMFNMPLPKILAALGSHAPEDTARLVRFYSHFAVGLEGSMVGFFLLSPLFVRVFEMVFAPIVALVLDVKYSLLRQQLSSGLWRAAGTCTGLMVGLAVLIVLQTEGKTALNGWKLPNKFPDIFIFDRTGISLADAKKLEDVPNIRQGEVMPIAITSPGLPNNFLGMAGVMLMPDRTMFIGIDPNRAFKLMELEFREGNAVDAERLLKLGHHVLVTTEYKQLKGLGLGDKLPLQTTHGFVDYTVAGVVWSPGIDVMVTIFDMGRQMDQRTAASVFGTIDDAQKDFAVNKFYLFAANLNYFVEKEQALKEVQKALKAEGMQAGDVRQLKARISDGFNNMLLMISTVAFAAMGVAALGVTNTVMASIRTRRWQFGILRSIGVTRSQLLRLVLGEAVLLGLVACALGSVAGIVMSYNAEAMVVNLTGYKPPMVIPWNYVCIGGSIVIVVSVLASLWPALWVARAQPLELLQAGRSAS